MSNATIREALGSYRGDYNRALFKAYIDDIYSSKLWFGP